MNLAQLLSGVEVLSLCGDLTRPVPALASDSRQVTPGTVFVCLTPGGERRVDRHEYVPDALARGAAAVVVEREVAVPSEVTVVQVADTWAALAKMAANFYGHPSRELTVVGITGTNGKTSTVYLAEGILDAAGRKVAVVGTVRYRLGEEERAAPNTTPEALPLQRLFREACERGMDTVIMEVSSHGLAQKRVAEVDFDLGVFTNLSQDHLDFHPTWEHYRDAKALLFASLAPDRTAILNADDPLSSYMRSRCRCRVLTFGLERPAEIRATRIDSAWQGLRFEARTPAGKAEFALRLVGEHNVYNALGALAIGLTLGVDLDTARTGMAEVKVPGRFELVDQGQDFIVAVDYAHTPGALERVLRVARNLRPRRLICVFGCGGDRDPDKRPKMGRLAAELADLTIVTSDNPRTEDPLAIIADIQKGIPVGAAVQILPDRREAIFAAVRQAGPGDIVLIAGKGHETYQRFKDYTVPFDDRQVAAEALQQESG